MILTSHSVAMYMLLFMPLSLISFLVNKCRLPQTVLWDKLLQLVYDAKAEDHEAFKELKDKLKPLSIGQQVQMGLMGVLCMKNRQKYQVLAERVALRRMAKKAIIENYFDFVRVWKAVRHVEGSYNPNYVERNLKAITSMQIVEQQLSLNPTWKERPVSDQLEATESQESEEEFDEKDQAQTEDQEFEQDKEGSSRAIGLN